MGMNNILFYKNFSFNKINFVNYHYTDHREGSPQNYIALMEKGSAKIVSDMGTIHIRWDCGSSLGVAYGEDSCKVVLE